MMHGSTKLKWCSVVVVLNSMPIFLFFNKLVTFLVFGLWKVNVIQIFFIILASLFVADFCSICRLSYSSRCCRKLFFLKIDCIISYFVCFLSGLRGDECVLVMWNVKASHYFLSVIIFSMPV